MWPAGPFGGLGAGACKSSGCRRSGAIEARRVGGSAGKAVSAFSDGRIRALLRIFSGLTGARGVTVEATSRQRRLSSSGPGGGFLLTLRVRRQPIEAQGMAHATGLDA